MKGPGKRLYANVAEAVRDIPDGATIMIACFAGAGTPTGLIEGLVDHGAKDLTIICNSCGGTRSGRIDVGMVVAAGLVKKVIASIAVLPGNRAPAVEKLVAAGLLEIELSPQGTLAERIRAGGAGIGGFYTPTGVGSAAEEGKEVRILGGRRQLFETPLRADFALLKAEQADTMGNLVYRRAARNYNPIMVTAAETTIVEVGSVVPPESLDPERIGTPGVYVDRLVCESRR